MADRLHLDALAEELTPFRPLSPRLAYAVTALYLLAGGVFVILTLGVRSQYDAGLTDPMFIIRTAILLGLGVASLGAVTAMARPGVGAPPRGWRWALGAALLIPAAALIAALAGLTPAASEIFPRDGKECLAYSVGIGLVLGGVLTVWLRGGAPVSPERAGIVIGLASGSFGALAYSMHCPHNELVYVGLWYTLAIAITTLLGRLIVPRFVRW